MTLSPTISDAYATLFAETGLGSGDASGRPGADQDGFNPAVIIADSDAASKEAAAGGAPGLLGFGDELREALLMPLRQLSFWKMKDRARQFGETGAHQLLASLQLAAPNARFHLMGHSFGCIVVSAMVSGATAAPSLPRPVDSLFLVQGALSLWSYADDVPYAPGTEGYFHRIVKSGLVRGPIVTTCSTYDTAVGRFYPLGAQIKKQILLGEQYPKYGGIGTFGIRGVAGVEDMAMRPATSAYDFREGRIYNLEASDIIKNGSGMSGAHSDIAHPAVAHALWAIVLSGQAALARPTRGAGRGLLGDAETVFGDVSGVAISAIGAKRDSEFAAGAGAAPLRPSEPIKQRWINVELDDQAADEPLLKETLSNPGEGDGLAAEAQFQRRGGAGHDLRVEFRGVRVLPRGSGIRADSGRDQARDGASKAFLTITRLAKANRV